MLFSLRAGASVVLMDRFEPREFATLVARHRVRSTALVPGMIVMLADCEDVGDLAPLRFVRSITAQLVPEVARRFRDKFGVPVLNSYGQTELGGEVVGWTAADIREYGDRKLGAVGRPYTHVGLRILDPDGREVAPGEVGEVFVCSPYLMQSYADAAQQLEGRMLDGYLRTGDLGRVDEAGFLWIHGRVSDMINRGGLKVHPAEVEEALRRHAEVLDACVAGVPDDRLGEVPFAWVRARSEVSPASLTAHCRTELAPYKVPVDFRLVEEFPRNETGKILRRTLVADYLRSRA
jgi:long-chain acyl-CoA synthetase